MAEGTTVPSGLAGIQGDFSHYCAVHGARSLLDKALLPLRAPSLWAMAAYRFGRWVYNGKPHGPSWTRVPLKAAYVLSSEVARHATGVLIHAWAELEDRVWIGSFAPVMVGAQHISSGTMIHGGVTLGAGGARGARGVPSLGHDVVVGPGATIVGPVRVPDGTTVGPNTMLTSTPSTTAAWLGTPPRPWKQAPDRLVPADPAFHPGGDHHGNNDDDGAAHARS